MSKSTHSAKSEQIRERREKISHLLAKGYTQTDVMRELGITNMTYCRDMKYINEMNDKQFYELAKKSPSETVLDYINSLDRLAKECWKIYNNPDTNVLALRTMSDLNDRKFTVFQEGSEMLDKFHHHDHDFT